MDQQVHTPESYDYRQYDRVWQRVAPTLEPYPGMGQEMQSAGGELGMTVRQESQLPGAVREPCCMGSAAADMLGVLTGFVEEALEDRRQLLALSRQAPSWARQRLREIAEEVCSHARRLMAVYYLITGECYRPSISHERIRTGRWCPALRERYHAAACSGLNYARAADGTTDPCLRELLNELSGDAYRQANSILTMLERAVCRG